MPILLNYPPDQSLSYAEYGDSSGFPILVQHGLIASIDEGAIFDRLIRLGARLICIARPGYGESSPHEMRNLGEWGEIVAALVANHQLPQFDVLAMSSGAPYAYAIAAKLPQRVRNIYVFSGIPALYDQRILAHWPFPVQKDATISEMQTLAYDLFFANLSLQDRSGAAVRDSMRNDCFGLAQDFKLRCLDWGFSLRDVTSPVFMRHSRRDPSVPFVAAQMTAALLPNCVFDPQDSDVHFSQETLDEFFAQTIVSFYTGMNFT